jgi:prepilin-type N-terminal cleavage/methylation domain-containing protein
VRAAFTLVELLVVITIMGVLTSIILFALAGAQESAKADKTRSTISKLNSLVMAKYESYRTRRVPVDLKLVAVYKGYMSAGQTTNTTQPLARTKVDVIRELMRMEMPDRYSDITDNSVTAWTDPGTGATVHMARPAVNQAYLNAISGGPITAYESAKCLYLLVSLGLDDPDVMAEFSEDEIATDTRDHMRYFVDGWGQPIFFLRWAPGFSSPLQPSDVNAKDALNNPKSKVVFVTSHDPFDPLKAYIPTVASDPFYNPGALATQQIHPPLYPLIYSAGPDRIFDIFVNTKPDFQYSTTDPPNDPYTAPPGGLFGAPTDQDSDFTPSGVTTGDGVDNSIDNITNHDLSVTQ